ncbi:MAG: DUF2878 domain-containing protein [Methylophilaceae bacterium]|nr:MAG: DUF2878 domain-containing protein [Methylophilaceae bacterium]
MIINVILFQVSWFACVLGAANSLPYMGIIVTAGILAWHLMQATTPKTELWLMGIALALGASFDQALLSFNLVTYMHHGWSSSVVPIWILGLWLGFSTILNVSLRWMRNQHLVAILFGFVGGPLAYLSAEKLGAVVILSNISYVTLALGWAIITPLLLFISKRFDGFEQSASSHTFKASNLD